MITEHSYDLIYADPPWRYDNMKVEGGADKQYPTMSLDEICALEVNASRHAVLAMWATSPKLPEAFKVIESWGFTYKTSLVWDKQVPGIGYWFRGQHELLLIATRGNVKPPPPELRRSSVLNCKKGKHSRKPYEVYKILETMVPHGSRLEMFARYDDKLFKPEGWDFWGNQAGE
jgi:N6-adenosine-specific RNA methylase IME4